MHRILQLTLLAILAGRATPLAAAPVDRARTPAITLSVVQSSDSALTLDSNSPATDGPHAMYVSYRITNTAGTSATNLSATISGFSGGITLAGSQPATQYVGT